MDNKSSAELAEAADELPFHLAPAAKLIFVVSEEELCAPTLTNGTSGK
jgi:hypothetical protein